MLGREGIRGLFRGIIPSIVGIAPSRAIYFATYTNMKEFLERKFQKTNSPLIHVLSGAASSSAVSFCMNPVWFVKTRIQLQEYGQVHSGSPNYKGYADCIRRVYKEEGILGFYKGLGASLLGVIECGMYFVIYERAKYMVYKNKLKTDPNADPNNFTPMEYLVTSASSKLIASSFTYPHEVIRTRMRELVNGKCPYNGLVDAFRSVWRLEGWRGLYSGVGIHLMRTVPNCAIMFVTFEAIMKFVRKYYEAKEMEKNGDKLLTRIALAEEKE